MYGDDVDDPYLYLYTNETERAPFTVMETNMSADLGLGIEVMRTFTGPCLHSPRPPDGLRIVGPTLEVVLSGAIASIL